LNRFTTHLQQLRLNGAWPHTTVVKWRALQEKTFLPKREAEVLKEVAYLSAAGTDLGVKSSERK
jgi:hypothetical protein